MINITEIYHQQELKKNLILIAGLGVVVSLSLIIGLKLTSKSLPSSEPVTTMENPETSPRSAKKVTLTTDTQQTKDLKPLIPAIVPPILEKRTVLSPPSPVTPPQISSLKLSSPTSQGKKSSPTETVIIPPSQPEEQAILTIIPQNEEPISQPSSLEKPIISSVEKLSPSLVSISPSETSNSEDNFNSDVSINSSIPNTNSSGNSEQSININTEESEQKYQFENVEKPDIDETESLFDYTPQIAQVREYFQKNWQPPEDFKHSLQYRLVINKSGYLQSVIPIGFNAELYLSQVKFPPNSQPFVSPFSQSQIVRLVIQSDGSILTFLEN